MSVVSNQESKIRRVVRDGYRSLRSFVGMHHCPFYISLDYLIRNDPMLEVHRLSTKVAFPTRSRLQRTVFFAACLASWPIRAIYLSYRYASWYGRAVKDLTGKGVLRQSFEQLGLALRHTIPPYEYYAKELFKDAPRGRATDFIFDYELNRLYGYLNDYRDTQVLSNKVAFRTFCERHDLPSVPIIAEFSGGRMFLFEDNEGGLPQSDLFIKQSRGSKGIGTMRWIYVGSDRYESSDRIVSTRSELTNMLKHHSHTSPYLVQPRAVTHNSIADLTTGAVVTARIVTARTLDGEIELLGSILKIPTGGMIGDHYVDGLFSPIDQRTGMLGRASSLGFVFKQYDHHPDTGAKITGRLVPQWQLAADLVQRAHAALEGFVFIGWDVALSPDGPVLLEGNHCPSSVLMERPSQKPFGQTRFPSICLEHARSKGTISTSIRRAHPNADESTFEF